MAPDDKISKLSTEDNDNREHKSFFLDALIYDLSRGFASIVSDVKAITSPPQACPYSFEEQKEAVASTHHSVDQEYSDLEKLRRTRNQMVLKGLRNRSNEEEDQISVKRYRSNSEDDGAEPAGLLSQIHQDQDQSAMNSASTSPFFVHWWCRSLHAFLLMSKYSPLYLEQHDRSVLTSLRWRDAFEDLLAATSGEQMVDEHRKREELGKSDWLDYMRRQANARYAYTVDLPLSHPAHPTNSPSMDIKIKLQLTKPHEEDKDKEFTELDLYEHFLVSQNQLSTSKESSPKDSSLVKKLNPVVVPTPEFRDLQIVSTLATTERVTMPDGTARTKMVLKKRFADGREESNETVHTLQGNGRASENAQPSRLVSEEKDRDKGNEKERKGWFWN